MERVEKIWIDRPKIGNVYNVTHIPWYKGFSRTLSGLPRDCLLWISPKIEQTARSIRTSKQVPRGTI